MSVAGLTTSEKAIAMPRALKVLGVRSGALIGTIELADSGELRRASPAGATATSGSSPRKTMRVRTLEDLSHQTVGVPVTIERVADSDDSGATTRRKWPVVLAISAALAILLAVAGVFGGLREQDSGPQQARPGATVGQGVFDVQVLDVRAGHMKLHEFDPAANLLIARMRVTNRGDQSYGVGSFVHGIAAEPKPGTYAEADVMRSEGDINGEETSSIHPRLPVIVQVVWALGNAAAPPEVTVALRTWEYGQSFTTDTLYWSVTKQSPITAKVSLPVRQGATS
jgi:hypothetical protein